MPPSPVFTLATLPKPEPGLSYYAVLGHPIAHSLSPVMQQGALNTLGIEGKYLAVDFAPEEFDAGIAKLREYGYAGWNVTLPHKERMAQLVDATFGAPPSAPLHSLNTVIHHGGRLRGTSTDGLGWAKALEDLFDRRVEELRIVILGAGGSAEAIATHAVAHGARTVTLSNRTAERAEALAVRLRPLARDPKVVKTLPWDFCAFAEATEQADLLVNATSVGLKPNDPSPVPPSVFRPGLLAYDLIYRPAVTPFLAAAAQGGAIGANGLSMLLHQGFEAFRHWHPRMGRKEQQKALAAMRRALEIATHQSLAPVSFQA